MCRYNDSAPILKTITSVSLHESGLTVFPGMWTDNNRIIESISWTFRARVRADEFLHRHAVQIRAASPDPFGRNEKYVTHNVAFVIAWLGHAKSPSVAILARFHHLFIQDSVINVAKKLSFARK